ncbi:hypothetical protein VN12_08755 [Pirellula sp. SH-Sr6A]|uniref:hypothetical protein n=1 Tax=Pirellula sp. SH-Sr6A TaxID=1632865 RepID=UPI00078EF16E|nr:hypothetical protein [Pirellula sp. SH-Sr6A]AMV32200.1 hypothetical protein VN12_08755 [Pirellula sp. SH-Sr6A]
MDWSLNPVFGGYWIIGLIGLGLLAVLILVQESGKVNRWQWLALWLIRLSICVVLLLLLLRPGVTFTKQSSPPGTVAILFDESASMGLPSGDGKLSRWGQQTGLLNQIWGDREKLGKENSWAAFAYSERLRQVATAKGIEQSALSLPAEPSGSVTDIAGPLSELMGASLDSPLSAVIWFGDGSQTQSPAGGDPLQMARRLSQLDIPLYVVGIGPRADSENSRDLSVEGVPEQLDVFTKNPVNVLGSVRCRGVANQDVTIRLLMRREGTEPQELARTKVRPVRADEAIPFQLQVVAPEPGAYEMVVEAIPVEREIVAQNNESTVYLNVRAGGARVLYIEGEARFEMKFIRRALGESPDIDILSLPINKPPVQKWPVNLREQLSGDVFDCIVLGDVDYRAIEAEGASRLADMVRNGAGLITLGGYHTYGAGGWGESALREVLPVQIGGATRNSIDGRIQLQEQINGPVKVIPRGGSEILQIDAPERNEETWKSLKPLLGANRWAGIKNNPGTVLLAESQNGDPLIVAGVAGNGKVLSLAVDSTFVWARQGKLAEHKAFWRKLIYWCMRRKAVDEGMEMRMTQRRLFLSQPSELIIDWIAGSQELEMPQNIALHLWKETESGVVDLGESPLIKRDTGSLRSNFAGAKEPGRYEWRARAIALNGKELESRLPFIVVDRSLESLQPIPDWQLMEQMARLNADAGGELLSPDQMSDVMAQLQSRRKQSTETVVENRKLGEGLIDSWTACLVFGLLMIAQWSLRKRWNLP